MFNIAPAITEADWQIAGELFREYAATLENDVCLVGFENELASMSTRYAPPQGALFLARADENTAGVVGVRRFADENPNSRQAEMKRLYVRPRFRGHGAGRRLTLAAVERARELGYTALVLDTLDTMLAARALYRQLGFVAYTPDDSMVATASAPGGPAIHYMRLTL
jgi:ribosomal protein S18 acetylase RimI-like enzyme